MTGGILQLVSYGTQDLFITGNPQITFFKTVYRRHTNFSRSEYDIGFNTRLDFGRDASLKIPNYGDLLHRLFLKIRIPKIDTRFRSLTVGEVKIILQNNDINWVTNRPNDEIFELDAFEEISALIDLEIDTLKSDLVLIDQIIPLFEESGELHPDQFFAQFPDKNNDNAQDYFDFVMNKLMELDQYEIQYKFVRAHANDRIDKDLDLANLVVLQNLMFQDFVDFSTGVFIDMETGTSPYDPASFNDENIFFIYNTDTANYTITGTTNQPNSLVIFRTGITNAYGEELFSDLDAFKIFNTTLVNNNTIITSSAEIQRIKQILLDNIRYGLIKNPKLLFKIYDSLIDDFKFTFYKKLTRTAQNVFTGRDDFVNLSQTGQTDTDLIDRFTADFVLTPEPNEPSFVNHSFGNYVINEVNNYHSANRDVFRRVKFVDYFNNRILWQRLDVGSPGDSNIDNFTTLCHTEIINLFGSIPNTLQRMYLFNYISLLTANDIPIAVDRHLNNRLSQETDPEIIANITAFKPNLITLLETTKDTIINTLTPFFCDNDTLNTLNKLSQLLRVGTDGVNGDIILTAIFKHKIFIDYNGQNVTFQEYVMNLFNDAVNGFTAVGFENEKENILVAVNTFATSAEDMPSNTTYTNLNNNLTLQVVINNQQASTLSNAISSIWFNIMREVVNNFNNLYNDRILGNDYFDENAGVEMKTYLEFITETFFNNNNQINYWFDTDQSILPSNDLTDGIGGYMTTNISNFNAQLMKFDVNRRLLNMRDLIISRPNFYFDVFNFIINQITTILEMNMIIVDGNPILEFDHENHLVEGADPVIIVRDSFLDQNSPKPKNNAMDIVIRIDDLFQTVFIPATTNPFTDPMDLFKMNVWTRYDTGDFNAIEESNKWVQLYGNITAQSLYSILTTIDVMYGGFAQEFNVYRYMSDLAIQNTVFNDLLGLIGNDVLSTYENIKNYYENQKEIKEERLLELEGNDDSPGLKTQFENTLQAGEPANFAWIRRLGHYIINCVSIKIGGQLIDKNMGEWLNIWYELTKKRTKERGYMILNGDVPELTTYNKEIKQSYEIIVPLKFWFCRHIGSALPLVALIHTQVEIGVKFRTLNELSYRDNFTEFFRKPKLNCELLAEYIYIEKEERNKLAKSKLEYLIDTVQDGGDVLINSGSINDETGEIREKIFFQNPIKELIFLTQNRENIDGSLPNGERQWFNYSININGKKVNALKEAKIEFSSRDREIFKNINFYNFVTPYQHHYSTPPLGVNLYSFSLNPEIFQPTGAANFSRIDDAAIVFTLKDDIITMMTEDNLQLRLIIYGTGYNILRIMSGQAGLVFFS